MTNSRVSIVVCTRDRPENLKSLLESVARLAPKPYEILIVDQSATSRTERIVAEYGHIVGLRYLHQAAVGLSRARNFGVAESQGDIVAFTDDDCRVAADFIKAIADVFARVAHAGLLFGRVEPGPHDESAGLVPHCGRDDEIVVKVPSDLRLIGGMGACMAAHRQRLLELGDFDVCLGAGARFPAAEETDLAFRALARGVAVVETPLVRVTHDGFRTWSEMVVLSDRYLLGSGAMHAKHARLWPLQTARLLVSVAQRWAWGRPRINYLGEPLRLPRLLAFARGWRQGMRARLDVRRGLFVDEKSEQEKRE